MRKLIKRVQVKNSNYIFNGENFEIFKINNENELKRYMSEEETICRRHDEDNHGCISKVVLNVSNECNLKCKYCYASGGKYNRERFMRMDISTLENIVNELVQEGVREIEVVSLFGGEPLINIGIIKSAFELFSRKFEIGTFEIVTNGYFLNEEIMLLFKKYNVKLSISIDGPEDVTDALRGKGTYEKVIKNFDLAQKIHYDCIEASATYTKVHEKMGYSYADINNFFENKGIKATISRVISNDRELAPQNKVSKDFLKRNIERSIYKIYNNICEGGINPFLSRMMQSMVFGSKTFGYCDDLDATRSIAYDCDGERYNCFHFWGDKRYRLREGEVRGLIRRLQNLTTRIAM